jgi:hypothetical protein
MTATILVEMRRPSVCDGLVRVDDHMQRPSCAQYQIGNALQVEPLPTPTTIQFVVLLLTRMQAKDWGNIMLTLYERDGWTLTDDSHTEKISPSASHAGLLLPSPLSGAALPPSSLQPAMRLTASDAVCLLPRYCMHVTVRVAFYSNRAGDHVDSNNSSEMGL